MELSDSVLQHLREVVDLPDLSGTRYLLEEEIGRGGLGVVYAARDTQLDRRVALKAMDAAWAGEARLIARLEHPGIVPVYETGTLPDGRAFYAMKLVAGHARRPLTWPAIRRWASDCAWCSAWARRWPTRTVAACCIAI